MSPHIVDLRPPKPCFITFYLLYFLSMCALHRRKFASFTTAEMTSLIRALFDDSVKRQRILSDIMEMAA
jgi:hypothetical protein